MNLQEARKLIGEKLLECGEEYQWAAMDNDGSICAYWEEPQCEEVGWYDVTNHGQHSGILKKYAPNTLWRETLVSREQAEEMCRLRQFGVGDKVRVVKADPQWSAWEKHMDRYVGSCGTIMKISEIGKLPRLGEAVIQVDNWWYRPQSLELVEDEPAPKTCPADYADEYDGEFDWLADIETFDEAIDALEVHIVNSSPLHDGRSIEHAKSLIMDFIDAEQSAPSDEPIPYTPVWQPTAQDYRECCGVWAGPDGAPFRVTPETMREGIVGLPRRNSRDDFDRALRHCERIEPAPAECLPGYVEEQTPTDKLKAEAVAQWPRVTEWD